MNVKIELFLQDELLRGLGDIVAGGRKRRSDVELPEWAIPLWEELGCPDIEANSDILEGSLLSRRHGLRMDDLIEIEETSEITGKDNNSDLKNNKATWPAIFGKKASHDYCKELLEDCTNYLEIFNNKAEPLRWLTQYLINRKH